MRPFPSLVLACLPLILAPAALAAPSTASCNPGASTTWGPADRARPAAEAAPWSTATGRTTSARRDVPLTSDGIQGPVARPRQVAERGPGDESVRRFWQVAPGVTATVWDERDARGPIRASLLTIDWKQPGITIDYANSGKVGATAPVRKGVPATVRGPSATS